MSRDLFDDRDQRPDQEPESQSRMRLSQGRGPGAGDDKQEPMQPFDLMDLRERIDRSVQDSPTVEAFFDRLEKADVRPIPSMQSSGRWNGISYEFAGVRVKGSDLGRAYTASGLTANKGLKYEPDRDNALLRAAATRQPVATRDHAPREPERPDRLDSLSPGQEEVLWEAGRFRTVAEPDLTRSHYGGDYTAFQDDANRLAKLGLIERQKIPMDGQGRALSVVSLTRKGKAWVKESPARESDPAQTIYTGIVKPREVAHDSAIYRMYLAEAAGIEGRGGHVRRVVLDYELKKKAYSPLAKAIDLPPLQYAERQQEIAADNDLSVVDGHIVLPDLRIEYETPEGELRHIDLELATRNYRGAHIQSKAAAGFKVYADTSSGRLSAVLDDHHLVAQLLRV